VYRYHRTITGINNSLIPVASGITAASYSISGMDSGVYYIVVVAINATGQTMSPCIVVTVQRSSGDTTTIIVASICAAGVAGIGAVLVTRKRKAGRRNAPPSSSNESRPPAMATDAAPGVSSQAPQKSLEKKPATATGQAASAGKAGLEPTGSKPPAKKLTKKQGTS